MGSTFGFSVSFPVAVGETDLEPGFIGAGEPIPPRDRALVIAGGGPATLHGLECFLQDLGARPQTEWNLDELRAICLELRASGQPPSMPSWRSRFVLLS